MGSANEYRRRWRPQAPLSLALAGGMLLWLGCSAPVKVGELDGGLLRQDAALSRPDYDECGNGMDDDADGQIDEGCPCGSMEVQSCFSGTYPHRLIGVCADGLQRCAAEGSAEIGRWAECMGDAVPGLEVCEGELDENCDGALDEGCACEASEQRACAAEFSAGPCSPGTQRCQEDGLWSVCLGAVGPRAELCSDVIDNDCDGQINEGCECIAEPEICGDGRDNDCDSEIDEPSCSPAPECIERATHVVEISGDEYHMCARIDDGRVFCWGDNTLGGLGLGEGSAPETRVEVVSVRGDAMASLSRDFSSRAVMIAGLNNVSALATSAQASSCVLREGLPLCFGPDVGTQYNPTSTRFESLAWTPTLAPEALPLTSLQEVATGKYNVFVRDVAGQIWAWGFSATSELGNPGSGVWTEGDPAVPALLTRTIDLDALEQTVCAVQEGGAVYCWGNNFYGQAGDRPDFDSSQDIPTPIIGIDDALSVEVGGDHSCALRRSGEVACWGVNGRRGDGVGPEASSMPGFATDARAVGGLADVIAIEASLGATCAIVREGSVYCWGVPGASGALLTTAYTWRGTDDFASPVRVDGIDDAVDIALGGLVTEVEGVVYGNLCVLERCGRVRCIGRNSLGQLGNGNTEDSMTFTEVQGLP